MKYISMCIVAFLMLCIFFYSFSGAVQGEQNCDCPAQYLESSLKEAILEKNYIPDCGEEDMDIMYKSSFKNGLVIVYSCSACEDYYLGGSYVKKNILNRWSVVENLGLRKCLDFNGINILLRCVNNDRDSYCYILGVIHNPEIETIELRFVNDIEIYQVKGEKGFIICKPNGEVKLCSIKGFSEEGVLLYERSAERFLDAF